MKDFFKRLKTRISALPKIYWIYLAALVVAEAIGFALRPNEPGLYTEIAQFAPLAVAFGFIFVRENRKNFRRSIYTYGISQFLFLALDYTLGDANGAGHAGLYQIATLFVPLFIFWLVIFARWNVARFREVDSRRALLLSTIAWGLYGFAFRLSRSGPPPSCCSYPGSSCSTVTTGTPPYSRRSGRAWCTTPSTTTGFTT